MDQIATESGLSRETDMKVHAPANKLASSVQSGSLLRLSCHSHCSTCIVNQFVVLLMQGFDTIGDTAKYAFNHPGVIEAAVAFEEVQDSSAVGVLATCTSCAATLRLCAHAITEVPRTG